MKLAAGQLYAMPPNFGPIRSAATVYHDVESVVVAYRTDEAALAALIPDAFSLRDAALIVTYACNRMVDWLAAREYNLIAVNVPVTFHGRDGRIDGFFPLVIWENLCEPILSGRELNGMPKLYADIPLLRRLGDKVAGAASLDGRSFMDLTLDMSPSAPLPVDFPSAASQETLPDDGFRSANCFGWRYIPTINGTGGQIDEFVNFPQETKTITLAPGHFEIAWRPLTWMQAPTQWNVISAIAGLPVTEPLYAFHSRSVSRLRPDLARALAIDPERYR